MTGNKKIEINFLEPKAMRYITLGDYYDKDDIYRIDIVKQIDDRYNLLILFHEIVEAILCEYRGIKEKDIMNFDLEWNKRLLKGEILEDEPGNQPGAPYYKEHRTAENFERLLAMELGCDWSKYEKELRF
jgi:hypothetical protein